MSAWQNSTTANDAHCLLQTLRSSDFITSSILLSDVLGGYLPKLFNFFFFVNDHTYYAYLNIILLFC